MAKLLIAFLGGALFSVGLGISGMTDPNKVIAFLDVTGNWDPSLAFVMAGAMVPNIILFRFILKRDKPVLDSRFHLPDNNAIDWRLVSGAALFGIGWGMSGYCPGPAITSVVGGGSLAILFVATMIVGAFLHRVVLPSVLTRSDDEKPKTTTVPEISKA